VGNARAPPAPRPAVGHLDPLPVRSATDAARWANADAVAITQTPGRSLCSEVVPPLKKSHRGAGPAGQKNGMERKGGQHSTTPRHLHKSAHPIASSGDHPTYRRMARGIGTRGCQRQARSLAAVGASANRPNTRPPHWRGDRSHIGTLNAPGAPPYAAGAPHEPSNVGKLARVARFGCRLTVASLRGGGQVILRPWPARW